MAGLTLSPYIDLHCHAAGRANDPEIRRIGACLDPAAEEENPFAAGIHPKDCEKYAPRDFAKLWDDPRCLAVGECGLDRLAGTGEKAQKDCFLAQIGEAEKRGLPVLLHIVRAYDGLLRIKHEAAPAVPWIVHGFRGNEKRAFELLDAGMYLSFGAGLLRDAGNVEPYFARIPLDRIFFETDESGEDLKKIYALAASFHAVGVPGLREQIHRNFRKVFHYEL